MPNTSWTITYGDYHFAIDRATLTYRLADVKTGTVWAEGLSIGHITFEEKSTGSRSRYDFGQSTLFSLSEKAGAQGKEILFGLDCLGIPIDLYFTCAEQEIKLTVEANRDSKTHRVREVCLLPGLCAAPDDGASYLVVPQAEGFIALARDVPDKLRDFPVWDKLTMPFVGAVRGAEPARSALALMTDSAYASARRTRMENGAAALEWVYGADPERRRLELRVQIFPGGDHIRIARAYREKIVGERNHATLRRKLREKAAVDNLLGGALVRFTVDSSGKPFQAASDVVQAAQGQSEELIRVARDLREETGVERGVCLLSAWLKDGESPEQWLLVSPEAGDADSLRTACEAIRETGFPAGLHIGAAREGLEQRLPEIEALCAPDAWLDASQAGQALGEAPPAKRSRWDDMDERMAAIRRYQERGAVFGSAQGNDWSAIACDFWWPAFASEPLPDAASRRNKTAFVPLQAVVYHDSVVSYPLSLTPQEPHRFLHSLLMLAPPMYDLRPETYFDAATGVREYVRRTYAVLAPLHRLSFPAFLTGHRFLTPDYQVEEAHYSNGARVIVNNHTTEPFENADVSLPPLGFLAEHPQFIAHDALRVGEETFPGRAWRITHARDEKSQSSESYAV